MSDDVTIAVKDGVALVTIDRAHARNAIAQQTMTELSHGLDQLETRDDVRVLVLRGAGDRAFVSGGDLKDLATIRDVASAESMARTMRRLLDRFATFPVPVIGAINGSAVGGGAEVALAADMRVAADDVQIGFAQAKLSIMPAWGGAERLVDVVGRSRAIRLIATGESISAKTAEGYGLFDVVCPRSDFEDTWRALAHKVASLPVDLVRSIKDVVDAARPHARPDLETNAVTHFARAWVSDAHWTAVDALRPARPAITTATATVTASHGASTRDPG
ncbi:enoyl-CoA hydratase/isomerase family protein [Nocardioides sp. cx-169]|uniref:enoyl-CoA hydratase/isomerase family protein n=1 Tax=Nocardioides sp. cx-169 TaxID=2899080 RepID=UPI001E37E79C|nr:enoyl-CoA hydratase/isomerase family protein [Nocardioides sp. cx-169]MCD4536482.1 enoyl-CoA hydratase/isomerase family protein [Nocardioides sp. cx-169]